MAVTSNAAIPWESGESMKSKKKIIIAFVTLAFAILGSNCTKDPERVYIRNNPLDPQGPVFDILGTYGGSEEEHFYSLTPTMDGGYLMAGTSYSDFLGAGAPNLYAVKTDASGNIKWQRVYGGDGEEYDGKAIATNDGGYALVGNTRSSGNHYSDIFLVKIDGLGNPLWEKTYGHQLDDLAKSIRQTADSGFVMAGFCASANAGWLLRIDKAGDTLWSRTFPGQGFEVELTPDGGYIVAAWQRLIKFDSLGNLLWVSNEGYCTSVEVVTDGYVTAYQNNVTKVDLNGSLLWRRELNGQSQGMSQTPQGDILITGSVPDSSENYINTYLAKLDNQGNIRWSLAFRGLGIGRDVHWRNDGSVVVCGQTKEWGGDGFFLKTKAGFEEGL